MKLKRKNLIISLIFPIFVLIAFVVMCSFVFKNYKLSEFDNIKYVYVFGPLIGAVLSILLTVVFSVDTSELFLFRIIYLILSSVAYSYIVLNSERQESLLISLAIIISVIQYLYVVKKFRKITKLLVVILSDPFVLYVIRLVWEFINLDFSDGLMPSFE